MNKDQQKKSRCNSPVKPPGPTPHMLALEPRYLFDAAALVTAVDVVDVADFAGNTGLPDSTSQGDTPEDLTRLFDHFVPADQRTAKEIIFVDPAVRDYNSLLQGISGNTEVVMLDKGRDGVEQISEVLAGYQDVRAVHILSHGDDASLVLGGTVLNNSNVDSYQEALTGWQAYLHADADILIYGCDVAAGEDGQAFIEQLAEFTGADIAASTDDTGAGGDWVLEATTGVVEADLPFDEVALATYGETLAAVGGEVFLQGDFLEVGIHAAGSFGTTGDAPAGFHPLVDGVDSRLGFVADPDRDGWTTGTPAQIGDYFLPGDPEE
ncbi:MAG: DUF4347 domain-containing protein, partial [Gammaproteobacteria bacterium]